MRLFYMRVSKIGNSFSLACSNDLTKSSVRFLRRLSVAVQWLPKPLAYLTYFSTSQAVLLLSHPLSMIK